MKSHTFKLESNMKIKTPNYWKPWIMVDYGFSVRCRHYADVRPWSLKLYIFSSLCVKKTACRLSLAWMLNPSEHMCPLLQKLSYCVEFNWNTSDKQQLNIGLSNMSGCVVYGCTSCTIGTIWLVPICSKTVCPDVTGASISMWVSMRLNWVIGQFVVKNGGLFCVNWINTPRW